jgi:hypothetical protein
MIALVVVEAEGLMAVAAKMLTLVLLVEENHQL